MLANDFYQRLTFGAEPLLVGRSPSLPAAIARRLYQDNDYLQAVKEVLNGFPDFMPALLLASKDLFRDVFQWLDGGPLEEDAALKLAAYILRMSYRPTPYGLFASVGIVDVGEDTSLALSRKRWSKTRLDVAWLDGFIEEQSTLADPGKRILITNNCAVCIGDRLRVVAPVHLAEHQSSEYTTLSLRNTAAVKLVRERALKGSTRSELVCALTSVLGLAANRGEKLVDTLSEHGVILPVDRMSLSTLTADGLQPLLAAQSFPCDGLSSVVDAMKKMDSEYASRDETLLDSLRAAFDIAEGVRKHPSSPLQMDIAHDYLGTLGREVMHDVAVLAETYSRLSHEFDFGLYGRRFLERYEGTNRLVPLAELMDSDLGVAIPTVSPQMPVNQTRVAALFELQMRAYRAGQHEIILNAADYAQIAPKPTWYRDSDFRLRSFEVGFQVIADDLASIQAGDYLIAPGVFEGSSTGAASLGRFAELIGPDAAVKFKMFRNYGCPPGALDAELLFMPMSPRAANVASRPLAYDAVIEMGIHEAGALHRLELDDLFVAFDRSHMKLYSKSLDKEVIPHHSCLLNIDVVAPALAKLLRIIGQGRYRVIVGFDWGPLKEAPFLPRLQYGRTILTPATWRAPTSFTGSSKSSDFTANFSKWAEDHLLPTRFVLKQGDNQLPIDRETKLGMQLLKSFSRRSAGYLSILEDLSDGGCWITRDGERYAHEFAATVVGIKSVVSSLKPQFGATIAERKLPPGSPWVFAKMYCAADDQDTLLRDELPSILSSTALKTWFFVRYSDPGSHLRLRFELLNVEDSLEFQAKLSKRFTELISSGFVSHFSFDTYVREIERYGGAEGIRQCEKMFELSSCLVLRGLRERPRAAIDRIPKAIVSLDPILRLMRTDAEIGNIPLASSGSRRLNHDYAGLVRIIQENILGLRASGDSARHKPEEGSPRLDWLRRENGISNLEDSVVEALVHMHFNRWGLSGAHESSSRAIVRSVYRGLSIRSDLENMKLV